MKRRNRTIDALMLALALNLAPFGAMQAAHAATIGSLDYAEQAVRSDRLARIHGFIARDEVRAQLLSYGVDAKHVDARLDNLTDAELAQIDQRIQDLPAGGFGPLAVVGIVFLVLIILELTGVTHIFNKV